MANSMSNRIVSAERLSLCIITFNRCESLAVTLESVAQQTYAKAHDYELLIVDNNCTDDTIHVIDSYANRLPLRHIVERQQGQSYGRNRAIAEFSGDVLLFIDDDVTLEPDWLEKYAIAVKQHPEADLFGGRSIAAFNGKRPKWLRDNDLPLISGVLVNLDYGQETRPFAASEAGPWGVSLGIRRRLFQQVEGFRVDLGPIGMSRGRADDTEFVDRALKSGAQRVYVGAALCWHRVDPRRLTWRAFYRHGFEKGRANALRHPDGKSRSLGEVFLYYVRGLVQLAKGRGDRARQCIINAGMIIGSRKTRGRSDIFRKRSTPFSG
jgi:glycosyltransferase involved in cell wall biosynthesis